MKTFLSVMGALAAVAIHAAGDPAPTMPREVTLTTGRVLRNVQVIRWESNRVVLKHSAGADPIPFTLFRKPTPDEVRTIMVAGNPETPAPSDSSGSTYTGRVAIVTNDKGTRTIEGATIYILPEEAWLKIQSNLQPLLLPKPIAILRSDRDGRFTFATAKGSKFVLLAQASMQVDPANTERFEWRLRSLSFSPGEEIELTTDNDSGVVREYKLP